MAILYNEIKLKNELFHKFRDICFEAAMTDLAKKSNPLAHSTPSARSKQIFSLVHGVLESVNGYESLEKALENDNLSIGQKLYLNRLDTICTKIATEASERVMKNVKNEDRIEKGANKDDKVNKTEADYVKSAKLTENELTQFKNSIQDMDNDSIAEVIEQKVLSTVKTERYAQMQDEMLKTKLKDEIDAISQSEDSINESGEQLRQLSDMNTEDDQVSEFEGRTADGDLSENDFEENDLSEVNNVAESYLAGLSGNYVLEPTSLFSTILEKTYESLLGVNTKSVLYRTSAVKIATEAIGTEVPKQKFSDSMETREMLKCISQNIEDFHGVNREIVKEAMNNEKTMDDAFGVAVDIYSVLEAFYSVGLIEPVMESLRGFVNQNTQWSKTKGFVAATESVKPVTTQTETFDMIYDQVLSYTKKCNTEIKRCNEMEALESYIMNGEFLVGELETIDGVNEDMLAFAIESVNDVMRNADEKADVLYDTTVEKMINYADDNYIAVYNAVESYGHKLMMNKAVESIQLKAVNTNTFAMEGIDGRGRTVSSYNIPVSFNYKDCNLSLMTFADRVVEHVGLDK